MNGVWQGLMFRKPVQKVYISNKSLIAQTAQKEKT